MALGVLRFLSHCPLVYIFLLVHWVVKSGWWINWVESFVTYPGDLKDTVWGTMMMDYQVLIPLHSQEKWSLKELSETLVRGLPLSKHPTLECSDLLAFRPTRKVAGDFILSDFYDLILKAWTKIATLPLCSLLWINCNGLLYFHPQLQLSQTEITCRCFYLCMLCFAGVNVCDREFVK